MSPGTGEEGHNILKGKVSENFNYAEQNGYIKVLISLIWKKRGVRQGLTALQYFSRLNRAQQLLISVRMSPLSIF